MRYVVPDKSLRKGPTMATCMVAQEANVKTNEYKVSNVTTELTIAKDKKQHTRHIGEGPIVSNLAKEQVPKGRTTDRMSNLVSVMATQKHTTIILGTKPRLRAPMVAHSTKVRKSNRKGILFRNICILVDESTDSVKARRSTKKEMKFVL